jgi:hypothetical protein
MLNLHYSHLLPEDFHPDSRVWVYQSSRLLMLGEALDLETMLQEFVAGWQTHGTPVKGYANLLFGQFIVLMADESQAAVSGCSTDSSVHLIKDIEARFSVSLFDRQTLAFVVTGKVQLIPLSQVDYAIKQGFIDGDTIYFNNIVASKEELETKWMIPVRESWLTKRYPSLASLV